MNPYEILGVASNATPAQIKRAFRKLAQLHHPDHGGDPEKFSAAKKAYETLGEPERRAEYDRTGKMYERPPDNRHVEVLTRLSVIMDMTIQNIEGQNLEWERVDFIDRMKATVEEDRRGRAKNIEQIRKVMASFRKLLGRFKSKTDHNHLEAMVRSKIDFGQIAITSLETQEKLDVEVLAFLKDYSFDRDIAKMIGIENDLAEFVRRHTATAQDHFWGFDPRRR